jgi:hypothetical protein
MYCKPFTMSSIYEHERQSDMRVKETKNRITYLARWSLGRRRKRSEIVPSDIHSLTRHTGKIFDTPRKGTMFGCRKPLHVAASHLKDYKAVGG